MNLLDFLKNLVSKNNFVVLIVCTLVGLFSVIPSISPLFNMGQKFANVWPELNGDRLYYFARIQEVNDGHPEINHPYFFEHKNDSYPQATVAERAMAFFARLTGTRVYETQIFFDFVSPFLIALLTYILLTTLGVRRRFALLVPLLLFTIVSGPILKPIHPLITFPLLLGFLICWSKLVLSNVLSVEKITHRKITYSVLSGVFLGLLFLTYFYHWSFILVVLGIHALVLLLKKDFRLFGHHILIVVIGVIVGLPYFLLVMKGINAPFHAETMVRVGVYSSHLPETIPRLLVALLWLVFFGWWGHISGFFRRSSYLIIFTLLIANIIYPNHQIITGLIIQNANHWSFMPIFLYFIACAYILTFTPMCQFQVKTPKARISKIFAYAVMGIACLFVLVPVVRLTEFSISGYLKGLSGTPENERRQDYRPVFDWINTRPKDSVVFSNADLMKFIPAYTYANVYYTDYAFNLPASDREVIERALLSNFFNSEFFADGRFGIVIDARILWVQPAQSERNTHLIYLKLGIPYTELYDMEREIQKTKGVYEDLKKDGWTLNLLKKYRIDYLIWDKVRNPKWELDTVPLLQKVYATGNFEIYSFKQ